MGEPLVMTAEQIDEAFAKAFSTNPSIKALTETVEEFKKLNAKQNQKRLFPDGFNPDSENETFAGSVADFSNVKSLMGGQAVSAIELLAGGGLFKRVSPAMDMFSKFLKFKLQSATLGIGGEFPQMKELVELNKAQFKSYYKDASTAAAGGLQGGNASDATGFLVPTEFPAIMIEIAAQISGIANATWRVPMTTNEMYLPRLDITNTDIIGGNAALENAAQNGGTNPTALTRQGLSTSKVHIKAGRVGNMIVLSNELIADAPINILNFVSAWMVRKYAYQLQYMILRGRGIAGYNTNGLTTDEPLGILSGVSTDLITFVSRKKAGTITYDDIINLRAAVKPELRWPKMNYIFNGDVEGTIRRQKDELGQPIFRESWQTFTGTPITQPTVMGEGVFLSSNMPALGAKGDMLYANLGNYYLGIRMEMEIEVSRERYFENYETAVRFTSRIGGNVGTPVAYAALDSTVAA